MKNQKTYKEIKESIPEIESEQVEVLSDELDRILALKKIFNSQDGKYLIDTLRRNCVISLNGLIKSVDNPDLNSILGLINKYSANLDLLAEIQDIKQEEEIRKQLDEAVKNALD